MPEVHSFGIDAISCHAWNKDRTQLAVSLNSPMVEIHKLSGGKWNLLDSLTGHSQRVTGIDWATKSNLIVTCGADCNAYVWTQQGSTWAPALVVLRISRAATCVKWSPLENKFAVGTGARLVAVCYYDKENDWWISKQIKKPIRSTVTCIDWHPNNLILACGSSDFKTRVYSAYIKEADGKSVDSSNWGAKLNVFGNPLQEFPALADGWIHDVGFSPSGDKLAWVGHDSTICVADAASGCKLTTVKTEYLPFLGCMWVNETNFVVAGFDCSPMVFSFSAQGIKMVAKLDDANSKQAAGPLSAKDRFKQLDTKATEVVETVLASLHQNSITWLTAHTGGQGKCSKLSTSGMDGQLVIWDIKA